MNKKFLGILAALTLLGATSVFAGTAVGVQGGYNPASHGAGAAITFKLSSVPCVFAVDADFGGNQLNAIGLSADWWVQNPKLAGMLHYYYGPGFTAAFYPQATGAFVGFRAVAGINIFPINFLEAYLQVAWQPGFYFASNDSNPVWISFPVNFGLRFWF